MSRIHHRAAAFYALASGLTISCVAWADHDAATMKHVAPTEIQWRDAPNMSGIKVAVLSGDPRQAGPYTIRVKFSPGAMSRPHTHPEERLVTVISGTWYAGAGEKFDPEITVPMPTGSFVTHFPGKPHFDGAKTEEVIVQISGIGPSATNYVHPEDAPAK